MEQKLREVCDAFRIAGEFLGFEEIKVGNVNRTYRVDTRRADGTERSYIVQAVNTYVFQKPVEVMENIDRVTEHIREKTPGRVALHFHHTKDRKTYVFDDNGFWRLFNFIPSVTYNVCSDLDVVKNAGRAFGEFQMQLSDFDAAALHETIPDFHNTKRRFETLFANAEADPLGRSAEVREELAFLSDIREPACRLTALYERSELPLRVTHNDTKINNVLFDRETGGALAVIDLDTVLPGLVGHDFGDAIRYAANDVEEDCKQPERAGLNLSVFRAFTEGFLEKTKAALSAREIETLPLSCLALTAELATRFLGDYLLGDPYFKTDYPEHNLVRTRCQIALAKDMLRHMEEMRQIVETCAAR